MNLNYELLIFDADGTLFDFARAERHAFFKTAEDFSADFTEAEYGLYEKINKAIWKEMELGEIDQETLKAERFRRFFNKLGKDVDAGLFSKAYLHNLSRAGFLFDGAEDLMKRLEGRFRMVLLTNGLTSVQEYRLGTSSVRPYFEELVISESVGVSKPDPRIFEHAFSSIGYSGKDKALIIGDSLTSDIKGGINFGIDTCWFNPGREANAFDYSPKYEVHGYEELLNLLKA